MRIHILGSTHPSAVHLYELLSCHSHYAVVLYARSLSHGALPFSSLKENLLEDDLVISFLPIWILNEILIEFALFSSCFRVLIAISSASIYSKVYKSSPDLISYLPFLIGEHKLVSSFSDFSKFSPPKIIILRSSMLWGCGRDKNISFIRKFFIRFRFFPVLTSGYGYRKPLHYHQLSLIVSAIINYDFNILSSLSIADLSGPLAMTYYDLILFVKSTVTGPSFVIKLPPSFVALLLGFFAVLPFKFNFILSILSMLDRQAEDLLFDANPHSLPINYDYPHRYSFNSLLYRDYSGSS